LELRFRTSLCKFVKLLLAMTRENGLKREYILSLTYKIFVTSCKAGRYLKKALFKQGVI